MSLRSGAVYQNSPSRSFTASAGTDITLKGRTVATLTLTATNLTNRAYQSHLSRLKYITDGGLNNMGRNIGIKISIYIA